MNKPELENYFLERDLKEILGIQQENEIDE
jgi:hypothetical protein